MANEPIDPVAAEREEPNAAQPRTFTAAQMERIRLEAAALIGVLEASLIPAEGRVIVRGDPQRTATLLFRLVGANEGVCLVWEDGRNKAVWLYERHISRFGTAA